MICSTIIGSEASGLQPGGVYHHQHQKYSFRVSESLKIEMGSQHNTIKHHAIGSPTIYAPYFSTKKVSDLRSARLFQPWSSRYEEKYIK